MPTESGYVPTSSQPHQQKRPATSAGLDLGLYAALFNASQGLRLELTLLWHRLLYPLGHVATKPYVPLPKAVKNMAGGLAVSPFFNPIPVWRQVRQPVLLLVH